MKVKSNITAPLAKVNNEVDNFGSNITEINTGQIRKIKISTSLALYGGFKPKKFKMLIAKKTAEKVIKNNPLEIRYLPLKFRYKHNIKINNEINIIRNKFRLKIGKKTYEIVNINSTKMEKIKNMFRILFSLNLILNILLYFSERYFIPIIRQCFP